MIGSPYIRSNLLCDENLDSISENQGQKIKSRFGSVSDKYHNLNYKSI